MEAVVIRNGDLVVESRPDPVPGSTELLVAVRGAGLNGADMVQRRGRYPAPPGVPADIPGLEIAGVVTAVGGQVTRFAPGDRVMALVGGGGQATMACVDEIHALPVPDGLSWPGAGGFPEVFSTAYDALFDQAGLTMGERVLVSGAAGGVGTAAVQLAAATGAEVVASVRDPARRDEVAALGAAVVVAPSDAGDHGPYDVILELVGAASLQSAFGALAGGGRVVVIGVAGGGNELGLDLLLLMSKRGRISGSTLRSRDRQAKATVADGVAAHVLPLVRSGRLRVPVLEAFPLAEAAAAYDRFTAGGKLGKIVLVN